MPADVAESFEAHRARVYRWAYAMCGRHEDALDIVQEVFLRMLKSRPKLANVASAIGWLRRVTSRVVIDHWRAESSRDATQQAYSLHREADHSSDAHELAERIRAALETLSEQQRLVLMAKTYDRRTFGEIANELSIAVPTVKTHYLRALSAIRERLNIGVQAGRVP